jgi:MFS family permease
LYKIVQALIGCLSVGVQYGFCFIGGILIECFSIRKVGIAGGLISTIGLLLTAVVTNLKFYLLTYGLVYGIGQALLLSATAAILPHYFERKLSQANGVMIFTSAFVIISLPLITSMILKSYGLQMTFYFLAALNFVTIFMAVAFKSQIPSRPLKVSFVSKLKEGFGDAENFKNSKYVCWLLASFIAMFGYLIPIVNNVKLTLSDDMIAFIC